MKPLSRRPSMRALVFLALVAFRVQATVLTFDPAANFGPIAPGYGDRVVAPVQGMFRYGTNGGFTPNVLVSYSTNAQTWTTDYGDLTNVAYAWFNGPLEITLTADPGWMVQLHGFDLAGWPKFDRTAAWLEVRDESGRLWYGQSNVVAQGDASGPRHTAIEFPTPLAGRRLRVRLDGGLSGSNVGLDNLRFSQVTDPQSGLLIWPAVEVGWSSLTGRTYQVEWTTRLPDGPWNSLGGPVAGNGGTNVVFDQSRGQLRRFYRVRVLE